LAHLRRSDAAETGALERVLMAEVARLATTNSEILGEVSDQLEEWLASPVLLLEGYTMQLCQLLEVTVKPKERISVELALQQVEEGVALGRQFLPMAERAVEYQRLATKKFKSSCPQLLSPTRVFINWYSCQLQWPASKG
jgi:hypothetical protein